MNTGMSLVELAKKVDENTERKVDIVGPANQMGLDIAPEPVVVPTREDPDGANAPRPGVQLVIPEFGPFEVNPYAHGQLATYLGIPKRYYDRMLREEPDLLTANANRWLVRSEDERMVRTYQDPFTNTARAWLSDRFRPLDNDMVLEAALPIMLEEQDLRVKSCAVTNRRLYVQAVTPRLEDEVTVGDPVQAGLIISNSEVGAGAVKVEPILYRLACMNGMITQDKSLRKYHVGSQTGGDGEGFDVWEADTLEADIKAFMLKVRDAVRAALSEDIFRHGIEMAREAADRELPAEAAQKVVARVVQQDRRLTQKDGEGVLGALIRDGDLSQWGLANAVTAQAHNETDYDKSVEFERVGYDVANLSGTEWRKVIDV